MNKYLSKSSLALILIAIGIGTSIAQTSTNVRTETLNFSDTDTIIPLEVECVAGTTLSSSFARAINKNILVHSTQVRDTNVGRKAIIRVRRVANQADIARLINGNPINPITSNIEIGAVCEEGVNVLAYGALGDGVADDTQAFRRAINAAPAGSTLYVPRGNYRINGQLTISKRVNLKGEGLASQIFQEATDKHLFAINQIRALRIQDLFLGSAGVSNNASLIRLDRAHYARIDRVTMGGGVNGIREIGSIGVVYEDLKTVQGLAFPSFFAIPELSTNQTWYLSRPQASSGPFISSNANMLINPILRAGTRGISIADTAAQGNHIIIGGIIEANSGDGLHIKGNGAPIVVTGTHFEGNGRDIVIDAGNSVSFNGVLTTGQSEVFGNSTDITFETSVMNRLSIAATAVRTKISNTVIGSDGNPGPHLVNNADDTLFLYAGTPLSRLSKARSTIGLGTSEPPNAFVAPHARIHVQGKVYASDGFEPAPSCPGMCPVEPPVPAGNYYLEADGLYPNAGTVHISVVFNAVSSFYEMKFQDQWDFMSNSELELSQFDYFASNCCDSTLEGTITAVTDDEISMTLTRNHFGFGPGSPFPAETFNVVIPRDLSTHTFDCQSVPSACF